MSRIPSSKTQTSWCLVAVGCLIGIGAARAQIDPRQACVSCHQEKTPYLTDQWQQSEHAKNGIGCYECHQAERSDPDAFEHNGTLISIIVSPKDCAQCHMAAVQEFAQSAHASAADAVTDPVGELVADYILGGGKDLSSAASSCWQCHGTQVKLVKGQEGQLEPLPWPSTGIGPINPDGSKGRCSACHSAHAFSVVQARQPESCELCHGGATSSNVAAIYRSSLHGKVYSADESSGQASSTAPTCAGCHMSAAKSLNVAYQDQPSTHDVGLRVPNKDGSPSVPHRSNMKSVCSSCHLGNFVEGFFAQFNGQTELLEKKWQDPAKALYCQAIAAIQAIEAGDYVANTYPVTYTYLSFTNRLGQAKRAASMMSPRWVEDSDMELAQLWFHDLVPELRAIINGAEPGPGPAIGPPPVEKLKALLGSTLATPSYYGVGWPAADFENCDDVTPEP